MGPPKLVITQIITLADVVYGRESYEPLVGYMRHKMFDRFK
jgi:hypothetical protein